MMANNRVQGFCKGCVGFCVSRCFYCCKGWCKGICKGCVGLPPKSLNLLLQGFARFRVQGFPLYRVARTHASCGLGALLAHGLPKNDFRFGGQILGGAK
jgi:hypothetical protein